MAPPFGGYRGMDNATEGQSLKTSLTTAWKYWSDGSEFLPKPENKLNHTAPYQARQRYQKRNIVTREQNRKRFSSQHIWQIPEVKEKNTDQHIPRRQEVSTWHANSRHSFFSHHVSSHPVTKTH